MKLTVTAFGQPLEVEWISENGRVFSSRTICFEMHSFPYLEKWDEAALRRSVPIKLAWKWIQHPKYGDQFRWPATSPVDFVDVIYLEYDVPPMTPDEVLLHVGSISWPADGIVVDALMRGTMKCYPKNSPNDLCSQIVSAEWTAGISGLFVVEATLKDGTVIFLREESGRERLVPSVAQQYILAQDQITSATIVQLEPQQSSLGRCIDDLLALSKDERLAFAGVLARIGFNEPYARAMADYAMGMTAKDAAKLAQISVKHFFRLKRRIPHKYRGLLSGSNKARRERAIRHASGKIAGVKEEIARHVATMRATCSATTAGDADQDDVDSAFLPEYNAGTPPTPVRGG